MRIALLGLGLIGGSVARALRLEPATATEPATPAWHVVAWSPSGDGPRTAVRDGVIDGAAPTPMAAIADADLVVLAAPATDCLALLEGLAGPWRAALAPGVVVTDVASTKGMIVRRAEALGVRFVGGHPMAGGEATGYAAATADLFAGRPWIVVPSATGRDADVDAVRSLARACGAHPVVLSAEEHDVAVAGISHLPLVASVALVEAVAGAADGPSAPGWPEAAGLAAGAWRDMTRIARGDPQMGAAIVVTNAPAIAERLRAYRAVIDEWLATLEADGGPDEAGLVARLAAAGERLERRADG